MFLPYVAPVHKVLAPLAKEIGAQLISTPNPSLKSFFQPNKPNRLLVPRELKTCVVYGIPCLDCQKLYVGQTKQQLKSRISSHKSEFRHMIANNSLVQHYKQTGHTPNFSDLKVFFCGCWLFVSYTGCGILEWKR